MSSFYRDRTRNGYRAQVMVRGVRRRLWLGNVTRSGAAIVAQHLERLKLAAETATPIPDETRRWARAVCPRIQKQLAKWGVIELSAYSSELPRTLGDYSQHYLQQLGGAESTRKRWRNTRRILLDVWPEQTALAAITRGECADFAKQMRTKYAPSHAGKLISDAKQVFAAAVAHEIIASNPFEGLDMSRPHDRTREHYISPESAQAMIAAADPFYAALIALARFGGLRVPSEPLLLTWEHLNLAEGRLVVPKKKTAERVIPVFPELRPALEKWQEIAPDHSRWIFSRARSSAGTVWRSNLERIITRAGLQQWPKLWQNLRASCRTDLEGRFPEFVVNAWLGHSSKIGRQHYTRVHAEHFRQACGADSGAPEPDCGAQRGAPAP